MLTLIVQADLLCGKCGKTVPEAQTELKGHEPGPHGHAGPCQWREHKDCGGVVQRDPDWRELATERIKDIENEYARHSLLVFVGTDKDLAEREKVHREKLKKKFPDLKADDGASLFVLAGWSRSGLDPIGRIQARVEINPKTKTIRVLVTRVEFKSIEGFGGADVMTYVGFKAALGKLEAGEYKVQVDEQVETYKDPGDKNPKKSEPKHDREFTFTLK